jgi:biotin transport system substrate-specific component
MPVMAALVVVLGWTGAIQVSGLGVPITLQTLGVMLAADLIGGRLAAGSMTLFWLAAAVGLPVLSGGRGGLAALNGPSGGYVVGFIVGALVIGLTARLLDRLPEVIRLIIANVVGGVTVIHAAGIAWLILGLHLAPRAAVVGDAALLPGDLIKAVLAALITVAVRRGYPAARTAGSR